MLVEVVFMAHEMCLQRENISEIKADIKELQSGMQFEIYILGYKSSGGGGSE